MCGAESLSNRSFVNEHSPGSNIHRINEPQHNMALNLTASMTGSRAVFDKRRRLAPARYAARRAPNKKHFEVIPRRRW